MIIMERWRKQLTQALCVDTHIFDPGRILQQSEQTMSLNGQKHIQQTRVTDHRQTECERHVADICDKISFGEISNPTTTMLTIPP